MPVRCRFDRGAMNAPQKTASNSGAPIPRPTFASALPPVWTPQNASATSAANSTRKASARFSALMFAITEISLKISWPPGPRGNKLPAHGRHNFAAINCRRTDSGLKSKTATHPGFSQFAHAPAFQSREYASFCGKRIECIEVDGEETAERLIGGLRQTEATR